MTIDRKRKEYPRSLIERMIATQMRLVPEDGELYDNAVRNAYAAFDIAEQYTGRIIVRSLVTFGLQDLMPMTDIPTAPVVVVQAVRYYDVDDRLQTLDPAEYSLIASEHATSIEFRRRPQLSPARQRNRVLIETVCGYSDYRDVMAREPDDADGIVLPGSIEAAVQLTTGTLCNVDGDTIIGSISSEIPQSSRVLLNPYRIAPYGWQD